MNCTTTRTIFVECTHTYYNDMNTGIQRVVRNILRNALIEGPGHNFRIVPVILEHGDFRSVPSDKILENRQASGQRSDRKRRRQRHQVGSVRSEHSFATYIRSLHAAALAPVPRELYRYGRNVLSALLPFRAVRTFLWAPRSEFGLTRALMLPLVALRRGFAFLLAAGAPKTAASDSRPSVAPGDILLLLDASWSIPIWSAVCKFKAEGGLVIGVVYDLIPISHPHTCVPEHTAAFSKWVRQYCALGDATITISRTVMSQFEMYNAFCGHKRWTGPEAPIRHFHLGAELNRASSPLRSSSEPAKAGVIDIPTFLMVGSIEPRKNHALVLDAFDEIWATSKRARLVLVGRQAWQTEDFLSRVLAHPQFGVKLFLLRDCTDAELEEYYRSSTALIIASEIEGFGLPIMESYQLGLPVICSDIPVFHEIAGASATYFDLEDPASLPRVITDYLETSVSVQKSLPRPLTWRESTDQLLGAISDLARSDPRT